jgi:hypothetical protein
MNLGTANSARGNDLPQQYRFTTVQNLQTQLNALSKKLRNKQVLYNNGALVGPVCGCFVFGIDYNNGNLYYRNEDNEWVLKTFGTGGGFFDAIVDFSVNANPNTVGTTFSPNSPALTTVLYVSTIDNSQWTYNGATYVSYVAPFWTLRGNTGTTPGTDFIGTLDNKDLVFKRNNIVCGRIMESKSNTTFGVEALPVTATGSSITAFGYYALRNTVTGGSSTAIGSLALFSNTTGTVNTALGSFALSGTTTGGFNIGIGHSAGRYNINGQRQIFINSIDRLNYLGDQTESPIYIQQNVTLANQLITLNGKTGFNKATPTETLDVVGNVRFSGALMPNNTEGTSGQVLASAGAGVAPTWQTLPVLDSGTYTPTLNNRGNAAVMTPTLCQYMRVGNVVTVSGRLIITGTVGGGTYTSVGITCPITPTFTTCNEAGGTASVFQDTTKLTGGIMADCGTGNKVAFSFYTPDTLAHNFSFSFTYKIT